MKRVMKGGALVSGLLALTGTLLWALSRWSVLLTLAITAGTVFYHVGIRLFIGCVLDRLLDNRTDPWKGWYQIAPWENVLYEKLRVKQWKKKIPTYDPALFDPSQHSWTELAKAMCQAELVHEAGMAASVVPLFFSLWFGAFAVFLLTAVLAAGYDLLFVVVQRCNRPRVLRLAAREEQRSQHTKTE